MQQKRMIAKPGRLILLALLAAGLAVMALMKTTIPPVRKTVEKELDAKAFLETPRPQQ